MRLSRALSWCFGLLALLASRGAAQEVTGTVVEARTGRPLEGARITAGSADTWTDGRGRFRLGEVSGQVRLSVVLIGFRPVTVSARAGEDVRILLSEQPIHLDEVVVTGTPDAVQKRSIGNSIATIAAADQQSLAPAPDVANLINGQAPGVVVIPGSGQVGAGPRIRIRGVNSFSLSGEPLVYIDGARVANDAGAGIAVQGFGSGIVSRLNDLNPNDIESIEIIKGPAAATLYGTEATNGVIQIITKKGKANTKAQIGFSSRQGTVWFMNPEGRIVKPVAKDQVSGSTLVFDPVAQESDRGTPLFRNGYGMGYGANLSGGTDAVRYHFSATYDRDNGIEENNRQRRFTTNANVTVKAGSKVDVQSSLSFIKTDLNQALEGGGGGIWFATLFGDPREVRNPDGSFTDTRGFLGGPPELMVYWDKAFQEVNRFTGSTTISHRPLSWLSHRLTVGIDQTDEGSSELGPYLPPQWVQFCPGDCALGFKFSQRRAISYYTADYSATARNNLTKHVTSNLSIGGQFYRRHTATLSANGTKFAAPGLETVAATALTTGFDDFVDNTTVGVYAQEQVSFTDKLYVTGAVRVDNNSAFGSDFSFIAYPKFSASYVAKEGGTGFLNALKLRAAYGQAGQSPAAFAALRTYQPVTGGDGGAAVIPQSVGNANLKPERATEYEGGIDASMLDDRLGIEFTAFYKKTRDAILVKPLAPSLGFPGSQFLNVGAIRNQGIELQVVGRPVTSKSINLDLRLSLGTNANKVLDLGPGVTTLGPTGPKVGDPVDAAYTRRVKSASLDATGRAINVVCEATDGSDTPCNSDQRVLAGRYDPKLEGAFNLTLTLWNRLRLYGLVDFKRGNVHLDNNRRALCQVFLECDENINPQNYDPRLIAEVQSGGSVQSFVLNDASFAKLRELSAAYTLPRQYARWFGASDMNVAVTARNLHTWTKWTGLDPESYFLSNQFVRQEQDMTPQLASFFVSVNLTF